MRCRVFPASDRSSWLGRAAALVRAGDGGLIELRIERESVFFNNVYKYISCMLHDSLSRPLVTCRVTSTWVDAFGFFA